MSFLDVEISPIWPGVHPTAQEDHLPVLLLHVHIYQIYSCQYLLVYKFGSSNVKCCIKHILLALPAAYISMHYRSLNAMLHTNVVSQNVRFNLISAR